MTEDTTPLDHLGAQAKAHITAGDRAKDKAEQHYIAAGLYLKKAHEQVCRTRGLNWTTWLQQNVSIGKSRSYELIAIANGQKTTEELKADAAARQSSYRQKAKKRPLRDGQSDEIIQEYQHSALVNEASYATENYKDAVRSNLNRLTNLQAKAVLDFINANFGNTPFEILNNIPIPGSRRINGL